MAGRSQLRLVSELTELAAGVNVGKDEIPYNFLYPGYDEHELSDLQAALVTPRPGDSKRRASLSLGADDFGRNERGDVGAGMGAGAGDGGHGDASLTDLDMKFDETDAASLGLESLDASTIQTPHSHGHPGLFRRGSTFSIDADLPSDDESAGGVGAATQHRRPRLFEEGGKGDLLIALGKRLGNKDGVNAGGPASQRPGPTAYTSTPTAALRGTAHVPPANAWQVNLEEALVQLYRQTPNTSTTTTPNASSTSMLSQSDETKRQPMDKTSTSRLATHHEGDYDQHEDEEIGAEEEFPPFPDFTKGFKTTKGDDALAHKREADRQLPSRGRIGESVESHLAAMADLETITSGRRRFRYDRYDDRLNEYIASAPRQPQPQNLHLEASPSRPARSHASQTLAPSHSSASLARGAEGDSVLNKARRPASANAALAYALPVAKLPHDELVSLEKADIHAQILKRHSTAKYVPPQEDRSTSPSQQATASSGMKERRVISYVIADLNRAVQSAKVLNAAEFSAALTRALASATPVLGTLHPLSVRVASALVGWLCALAAIEFSQKNFSHATVYLDQALTATSLVSPPTLRRVLDALDAVTPEILSRVEETHVGAKSSQVVAALWQACQSFDVAPLVELLLSPSLPVLVAARLATLGIAVTITRAGGALRRTLIVLRERLALHNILARAEKHPLLLAILRVNPQVHQSYNKSKHLIRYRSRLLLLLSVSSSHLSAMDKQPEKAEDLNDVEKQPYAELARPSEDSWTSPSLWKQLVGDVCDSTPEAESDPEPKPEREVSSRECKRELNLRAIGEALESTYLPSAWLQRATAFCSSMGAARFCENPLLEQLVAAKLSETLRSSTSQKGKPSLQDARRVLRGARDATGAGCAAESTYLNLCAVYSELGSHDKALKHAESATSLIQQELMNIELPGQVSAAKSPDGEDQDGARSHFEQALRRLVRDKLTLLCVAHHNSAVELEHLHDYQASYNAYARARELARDTLSGADGEGGGGSKLAKQLEMAAAAAAEQVAKLMKNQEAEREKKLARLSKMGVAHSTSSLLRHESSQGLIRSNSTTRVRPSSASRLGRPSTASLHSSSSSLLRSSTQRR